ncbi:hypothetical protein FUSO7_07840 [Fusobacterium necrophorum BFTR-2]|nr:hypothetical protein [Fusobacterium necrophorum]KDE72638.1 hypothetical protein FUSO7_07840 [Fusobacterium necrophorum BFTR-2]
MKKKKLILIMEHNYEEVLNEVLRNPEIEYKALTVFYRMQLQNGLQFLKKLKRIFPLENIVLMSDIEYLANDLEVSCVIELKEFYDFNLEQFLEVYESSVEHFESFSSFLQSISDIFHFSFHMYEKENAWFYLALGHGILVINDENYEKILQNYHKIKAHTSDLAFINLNEEGIERNLKLLKMLGSDSQITFGLTNSLKSKFSQWIDVIIYQRSPHYEKNIQNFIFQVFSLNSWEKALYLLQNFLEIEKKSFEADLYEEEEDVLKTPKRFFLKIEEKIQFLEKAEDVFYCAKDKKEHYRLEKDRDFLE